MLGSICVVYVGKNMCCVGGEVYVLCLWGRMCRGEHRLCILGSICVVYVGKYMCCVCGEEYVLCMWGNISQVKIRSNYFWPTGRLTFDKNIFHVHTIKKVGKRSHVEFNMISRKCFIFMKVFTVYE